MAEAEDLRERGRRGWAARRAFARASLMWAAWTAGCGAPTPEPPPGVAVGADGLFRTLDFDDVPTSRTYDTLLDVVKLHFGGGAVFQDPERGTIQVVRAFQNRPKRVQFFAQVSSIGKGAGSRVELFSRVEELREDVGDDPENPWVASDPDRDLPLEDFVFQALREDLALTSDAASPAEAAAVDPAEPDGGAGP